VSAVTGVFFRFARVFGPNSSQAEVYSHCVHPLLCRVMNGQNASVFAYGPTGSGMKNITNNFSL